MAGQGESLGSAGQRGGVHPNPLVHIAAQARSSVSVLPRGLSRGVGCLGAIRCRAP